MHYSRVIGAAAIIAGVVASPTRLAIRQEVGLVMLVESLIDQAQNAYDVENMGTMCNILMGTRDGGNCFVEMLCNSPKNGAADGYAKTNGDTVVMQPGGVSSTDKLTGWEACYVGGRQFFTSDNLGSFSIEFSRAGGVNGDKQDGLHNPILRVDHIDSPIDVQADIDNGNKNGHLCIQGADCNDGTGRPLCWHCAIPSLGNQYGFSSNNPGITATSFVPGTCGVHFIDYQIPKDETTYFFAARVVDHSGAMVAQVGESQSVGDDRVPVTGPMVIRSSLLPFDVTYTRAMPASLGTGGDTDDPPITFDYNGQHWDTTQNGCSVGKFSGGARQGDCVFPC